PLLHSRSLLLSHNPSTSFISTLSLHDALPIFRRAARPDPRARPKGARASSRGGVAQRRPEQGQPRRAAERRGEGPHARGGRADQDRKSTRLNSSHRTISYAVFCLKKKKKKKKQ